MTSKRNCAVNAMLITACLLVFQIQVFAQTTRTSVRTGNWSSKNVWDCNCVPDAGDHVIISTGHTVTRNSATTVNNLTIQSGGIVSDNGGALTVTGNLLINGTLSGTGATNVTGNGTTIGGTGIISNTGTITLTNAKTISTGTMLAKNTGNMTLGANTTVNNLGDISIGGSLIGTNATTSVWTNGINSSLSVNGNLLTTGVLNASAAGNTIDYTGTIAQTVKLPSSGTYFHLFLSGVGTKTMANGNYAIDGDLNITSTLNAGTSGKTISIKGNWINNGTFTPVLSTVSFTGNSTQSINRASSETFYGLQTNKTGTLQLNCIVTVSNTLTMTNGLINTGANKLTLGTSTTSIGTLNYVAGNVIGSVERYVNQTNINYIFPVGTSSHARAATIQFKNLTAGSLTVQFNETFPGRTGLPLSENGVTFYNTFRDGYWSMTRNNGLASTNYTVSLNGNGFSGFTLGSQTRIVTRTNSAASWTFNGTNGGVSGTTVTRTSINTLSAEFAFADPTNCTAPVAKTIQGPVLNVCTNSQQTYSTTKTAGFKYAWTVTGGTILTTLTDTTSVINVRWGNNGITGQVTLRETSICTTGPTNILSVNLNPMPPMTLTGRLTVPENGTNFTYSIPSQSGYLSYTWSVAGGTLVSGQGTNSVGINWGASGIGTICISASHPSCGSSVNNCFNADIYRVVLSQRSGNWNAPTTWNCNCVPGTTENISIQNRHTVTVTANQTVNHLSVNGGGTLVLGTNLIVTGDLTVNGTLAGSSELLISGSGNIIDGRGNLTLDGPLVFNSSKRIAPTTRLTKTGSLTLGSGATIINEGYFELDGSMVANGTARWTNAAGSTLAITGTLLQNGELDASASGNTVIYEGAAQSIKAPVGNQYANLTLTGTATKTAPADLKISGDLTVDTTFDHNDGTITFNGNTTISGNSIPVFRHVRVEGILTAPSSFELEGDLTVDNRAEVIRDETQTTWFKGTTRQNISGKKNAFRNLRVSNAAGVFAENSQDLYGQLTLDDGAWFDADGSADSAKFVMQSTADNPVRDASLGPVPNAARVTGKVTVERFVSGEGRFYRYISSPVANATVADLKDDFMITGNFVDPTTSPTYKCGIPVSINGPSMYYYNEAVNGGQGLGYVAYPLPGTTAAASPLVRGLGYSVYLRQCSSSDSVVVDLNGELHQGTFALPVSFTNTPVATPGGDGWNLVGNPYASPISWNLNLGPGGWIANQISPVISVRDAPGNRFIYIDGSTTGGTIAIGQAFWVQALAPGASLTIQEGVKVGSQSHSFYRRASEPESKTTITLAQHSTGYIDEAFIRIIEAASEERDAWDALKLDNESFDLYTKLPSGNKMAINSLSEIILNKWMPLEIADAEHGVYSLKAISAGDLSKYVIQLRDDELGKVVSLNSTNDYTFEINSSSRQASRFMIRYIDPNDDAAPESLQLLAYPNPTSSVVSVSLPTALRAERAELLTLNGEVLQSRKLADEDLEVTFDLSSSPVGIYIIKVNGAGRSEVIRVVRH